MFGNSCSFPHNFNMPSVLPANRGKLAKHFSSLSFSPSTIYGPHMLVSLRIQIRDVSAFSARRPVRMSPHHSATSIRPSPFACASCVLAPRGRFIGIEGVLPNGLLRRQRSSANTSIAPRRPSRNSGPGPRADRFPHDFSTRTIHYRNLSVHLRKRPPRPTSPVCSVTGI